MADVLKSLSKPKKDKSEDKYLKKTDEMSDESAELVDLFNNLKKYGSLDKALDKVDPTLKLSLLSKEQKPLQSQLESSIRGRGAGGTYGQTADYYRDLLANEPEYADQFAKPEMQTYSENIVPGLSSQFGGIGSLSNQNFKNASGERSNDLNERLTAMRAKLRMGAAEGLNNIGNFGLRPTIENIREKPQESAINPLMRTGGQMLGNYASNWMTNRTNQYNAGTANLANQNNLMNQSQSIYGQG